MQEIERKFIMQGMPEKLLTFEEYSAQELECLCEVKIEQGYISIEPEVRLHGAYDIYTGEENYRLTLKSEGNISRTELITDVSKEFYEEAKKMLPGNMIYKRYRKYRYGERILEVCHVEPDTKDSFYYGEIEFDSEEEAKRFVPPAWLGVEVTQDENYKMKNYWKRTREL